MAETWKAFIVSENETTYTILSEKDKTYHTLPLPKRTGFVRLDAETVVIINDTITTPTRLFSALSAYMATTERKRRQYQRKKLRAHEEILKDLTD